MTHNILFDNKTLALYIVYMGAGTREWCHQKGYSGGGWTAHREDQSPH